MPPRSEREGPFGLATIPASLFDLAGTLVHTIASPNFALSKITVMAPLQNPAASFQPGGAMGVDGVVNLFFTNGAPAGFVPLHYVGTGGTGMLMIGGVPAPALADGTWRNLGASLADPTRTIMLMSIPAGFTTTVTGTAFDHRTSGGRGTVQLVAPMRIRLFAGLLANLPVVGTMTLQYVPEPGTWVLVAVGVIGTAAWGSRVSRR